MASLRHKQIESLKSMFNFNTPYSVKNDTNWKVLIFDQLGNDIIAPHFTIKELRDFGITLHLHIDSSRESIPDAPAIYFVYPSTENIERIGKDCSEGLYEKFYLNFISPLSRHNLDVLAAICVKNNCSDLIAKIYDQYLNFMALEDSLVILENHQYLKNKPLNIDTFSFYNLNSSNTIDTHMEKLIDTYVDKLFCIFTTLVQVPVIFYPKFNNAAKYIGEKLFKKMQDNLKDPKNNLFISNTLSTSFNMKTGGDFSSGVPSFTSRCCLILVDRYTDLVTPFSHSWTYQALIQDLFEYDLNKVVMNPSDDGANHHPSRPKIYDLYYSKDKFWREHKGSPFPAVAEAIQTELENYKSKEAEVRRLKHNVGSDATLSDDAHDNELLMDMLSGNTNALSNVVNSLPQLLETKKYLDMHTNIATDILNVIKQRKLDQYFEMEEKILAKASYLDPSLYDFLKDPSNGDIFDKIRLFIVAYLCEYIPQHDKQRYLDLFNEYQVDDLTGKTNDKVSAQKMAMNCVSYLDKLKSFLKMSTSTGSGTLMAADETGPSASQQGFAKKIAMFSKLMSQGSQFVMEGVQNFVVKQYKLPVTRLVDKLSSEKSGSGSSTGGLPINLSGLTLNSSAVSTNTNSDLKDKYDNSINFQCSDPKILKMTSQNNPTIEATIRNQGFSNVYVCLVGGGDMTEFQNLMDYAKSKANKRICYISTDLTSPTQFVHQIMKLGMEDS